MVSIQIKQLTHRICAGLFHAVPIYFKQTQYKSFQRQLSLYGFRRLSYGLDSGAYYHCAFVRGRHSQCSKVSRKGGLDALKPTSGVAQDEPNFYTFKWAAAVDKCNIWQYLKNHEKEVPKPDENKTENNNTSVVTVATQQMPPQASTQATANVEFDIIEPMAFDTKLDPILSLDLALVSDDSENGAFDDVGGFPSLQSKIVSNKSDLVIPTISKSMLAGNNLLQSNSNTCTSEEIDAFEGFQLHSVPQGQVFDQRLHEPIAEDFFVTVLP